ncbi:hypothetical protein [Marinilabilia salmonicolor]|uniref:hypothetical protein n=1 Tax=Marinilabilia salmonicolor TaxID=989 RepID=UPI000299FE1C|nr:hypothetical protein [Marinilabilia salmonicolor]
MKIIPTIEKYLIGILTDEFHRFTSWDNCHLAFSASQQSEIHSLELAFYLASWGMYRGSSGLLQKNHLIHRGAVDILFSHESQKLKCNSKNDVVRGNVPDILNLKIKLADHYRNIYFTKGEENPKSISPTDTLLSKILLGTLGCIPAFDRYFIDGLKEIKIQNKVFDDASLNELFDFVEENKTEIKDAQKLILTKTNQYYPIMKILDMYFWQIGYDKELMLKQEVRKA